MKTLSRWTDCKVNGNAGSHFYSRADRFLGRFKNIRIDVLSGALIDIILHLATTYLLPVYHRNLLRRWKI